MQDLTYAGSTGTLIHVHNLEKGVIAGGSAWRMPGVVEAFAWQSLKSAREDCSVMVGEMGTEPLQQSAALSIEGG